MQSTLEMFFRRKPNSRPQPRPAKMNQPDPSHTYDCERSASSGIHHGFANKKAPTAVEHLAKSLLAKRLATYRGQVDGM